MKQLTGKAVRCLLSLTAITIMFSGSGIFSSQAASGEYVPYSTYIYDYNGYWTSTPHAYLPQQIVRGEDLGVGALSFPTDVETGSDGCLYISDTGNNRILKLDNDFKLIKTIEAVETPSGIKGFNNPQGLFVNNQFLYVADSGNARVLKLTFDGQFVQEIGAPKTSLLGDDFVYEPRALVSDAIGNLFVVAKGVNMGLLRFDAEGNFVSFFASQEATYSLVDYLWKPFMTEQQLERMADFVPTEYNNVSIDKDGFLYVTTNDLDLEDFLASLRTDAAPVKKINPMGNDVLARNGYFSPAGDVMFELDDTGNEAISIIMDVAVGNNGIYTLLDTRMNRLFTYSANGELLYAFSGKGYQVGNTVSPSAVTYHGSDLVVLDKLNGTFTIFNQTEYGALISNVLDMYNKFQYKESVAGWKQVLTMNPNFDIAYDGIGSSFLSMGDYKTAMEYFQYSNNKAAYSDAYKEYRNEITRKYLIVVILIVVLLLWGLIWLSRRISRRNLNEDYKDHRETLLSRILYGFYVIVHPFDGFYDLKHEGRGDLRAATFWLFAGVSGVVCNKVFTSYLFNASYMEDVSIPWEYLTLLIPLGVWVVSNWCITTLVDGEGRMRDIYMFTGYAMVPVALLFFLTIPLSYLLVSDEGMYLTLIQNIALIWFAFLMFCGNTVVHQYTGGKSVLAIFASILGIAIMIFVALLLLTSYQKIASLVVTIMQEISYR
ncbi:MAG: YIP1 family protein [Oscillospiraceae bacterium]|nr:YIP1 family protein [Oscillospiraceae bacterium]